MGVIDELLARDDVEVNDSASRSDVDAVSRYYDAPLPELLVKLWRASDGVTLEQLDAHVLGPSEIRQLLAEGAWNEELVERGFLPVLDDHQSNYLVVIVRDPLAFRVAHVPHDDGSRLLYRDFETCVSDLLRAMDREDSADIYLHDAQGDYAPDAPRPEEDQDAARELMRTPGEREEWNYAAQLLDTSNLAEWAKLLETDHFVRRDVRARMKEMSSPAIRSRQDAADLQTAGQWHAYLVKRLPALSPGAIWEKELEVLCGLQKLDDDQRRRVQPSTHLVRDLSFT